MVWFFYPVLAFSHTLRNLTLECCCACTPRYMSLYELLRYEIYIFFSFSLCLFLKRILCLLFLLASFGYFVKKKKMISLIVSLSSAFHWVFILSSFLPKKKTFPGTNWEYCWIEREEKNKKKLFFFSSLFRLLPIAENYIRTEHQKIILIYAFSACRVYVYICCIYFITGYLYI